MQLSAKQVKDFQQLVLEYYHAHGRHNLPWRTTYTTPYHILVSEIMLQQTQVDRVIPKFLDFIATFPTIQALSTAPQSLILTHWVGLGYNRRARMLHQAAQIVVNEYEGILPQTTEELIQLPGIGPYAAASIPAFAHNLPTFVLDTNIRAIYIHHFFEDKVEKINDQEILSLVKVTLDAANPRDWYSALMDYGTYLKSTGINPIKQSKHYARQSKFTGSNRQLRGAIIRMLTQKNSQSIQKLSQQLIRKYHTAPEQIEIILTKLTQESLVNIARSKISLN